MSEPKDDLEAVRIVVATLDKFDSADRERIVRWAREKLGMSAETTQSRGASPSRLAASGAAVQHAAVPPPDIRSFINQKDPKSDNHLVAVVAYYHHFHAPPGQEKETITKEDLVEACRRADRRRPARPAQVLVNAFHAGLLDKTDRAHYRLNSVGENLVAMVLPEGQSSPSSVNSTRKASRKKGSKKKAKKKATRAKRT